MYSNEIITSHNSEEKSKNVQNMFNTIAGRYDMLNRLLSFHVDSRWRKAAIKAANIQPEHKVLDLACGTGEVILEIHRQAPQATVIGGDFSKNMLLIAKEKLPQNLFSAADAQNLPFKDGSFNRITMAFGFRNVADKDKCLKELRRVLTDDGKAIILEFSEPNNKLFAALYKFYFDKILPFIGSVISGSKKAYKYLPESVHKFPKDDEYGKMILNAGFKGFTFTKKTFGVVTVAVIDK